MGNSYSSTLKRDRSKRRDANVVYTTHASYRNETASATPYVKVQSVKKSVLTSLAKNEEAEVPTKAYESKQAVAMDAPFQSGIIVGGNENKKIHIVIVGCGFAGLATAIATARQGYTVTLIEKGSGLSPHGDNISLGANAAKILLRWGLGPEIWNKASKGGWWLMKDYHGTALREEDLRDFPTLFGSPLLQGHRAQFLGILGVEARMLMVNLRMNCTIVDYIDSSDQPAVVTKEGDVIYGDVIVVADGIHSTGRNTLQDKLGSPSPKIQSNHSVYRAAMSSESLSKDPLCRHLLDGCVRSWLGHDAHAIVYPIDNGRQISFTFVHKQRPGEKPSTDWGDRRDIREVISLLDGWDPVLTRCISYFKSCLNWAISEDEPAAQWVTTGGRIVCVGDSVHPLQPTSFQGGSQAIEDGACLGLCLALSGNKPDLALKVFQDLRRPRALKAHEIGLLQRKSWHSWVLNQNSKSLALLVDKMYDHDAELYTISQFEHVAQTFDSSFSLPRERRRALLHNLSSSSITSGSHSIRSSSSSSSIRTASTQGSSGINSLVWPSEWRLYDSSIKPAK